MLVVVVDDLFGVVHAAVTDFDGVAVKYFAEAVYKLWQARFLHMSSLNDY